MAGGEGSEADVRGKKLDEEERSTKQRREARSRGKKPEEERSTKKRERSLKKRK